MTVRWDRLPEKTKKAARRSRRGTVRQTYRCCGRNGCGEILEDVTADFAQRHADTHGGARIETVIREREGGPDGE